MAKQLSYPVAYRQLTAIRKFLQEQGELKTSYVPAIFAIEGVLRKKANLQEATVAEFAGRS